ncbi:MAG: YabP/YqfC family sporulation protein [Clostridia bacterium]
MEEKMHKLILENRRHLILSGVTEVNSSEDKKITLKTVLGDMVVEGQDLRILNLDLTGGEASIGGRIDALIYAGSGGKEKNRGKNRLGGKLFK